MIKYLQHFFPIGGFGRNVLTMLTGISIAQLIPLAVAPLLTRIYTPQDFGLFALYLAITSIIGVIATGRYELAVMLPKKDENAFNIAVLSILITFGVSIISLVFILIFNVEIAKLLGNKQINSFLYLVPISILIAGFFQTFNYWGNRKKQYKRLASCKIFQTSGTAVGQIGMGLNNTGPIGMILGNILGQVLATGILGGLIKRDGQLHLEMIKKDLIKKEAFINLNFPAYSAPMGLINSFQANILIFFLTYFSSSAAGLFSLSLKAISLPLSLISASFASVFYQKIINEKNKAQFYKKAFIGNLIIGVVILLPVFLFGEELFVFVFGKQWEVAGKFAEIMCPWIVMRFASGSVSLVFSATRYNHMSLLWQIFYTTISVILLYVMRENSINTILLYFSMLSFVMYILLFFVGLNVISRYEASTNG